MEKRLAERFAVGRWITMGEALMLAGYVTGYGPLLELAEKHKQNDSAQAERGCSAWN